MTDWNQGHLIAHIQVIAADLGNRTSCKMTDMLTKPYKNCPFGE